MTPRTKIAAGVASVGAIAIATGLFFAVGSQEEAQVARPVAVAPVVAPNAIVEDQNTVRAGRATQADAFFASIERDGVAAPMYVAMHQEFPERYEQMKQTVRSEIVSGTLRETPAARTMELTKEIMASVRDLVRQASDDSLRKIAASQFALLSVLSQKNVAVCARYAAEGGYADLPQDPETTQAVVALSVVQIHAAGDAARSPLVRAAPTQPVFMQLVQRMRTDGITNQQIFALGDAKLSQLPPEEQCRVVMSMYRSSLGLPAADAGVLLASIIKS